MDSIKKILAPTDLSDLSLVGASRALSIAATAGAEVIVYHPRSLHSPRKAGRAPPTARRKGFDDGDLTLRRNSQFLDFSV